MNVLAEWKNYCFKYLMLMTILNLIVFPSFGQAVDSIASNFQSKIFSKYPIIGLGEESHGIKTINQHRNNVVFDLIKNYEVKYIAWEEEFGALEVVNKKLNEQNPNFDELVKYFTWFWQTEETIELLKFIYKHNRENTGTKIQLLGIDLSSNLTMYNKCMKFFEPYISDKSILEKYAKYKKSFETYKKPSKKQVTDLQTVSSKLSDELLTNNIYKEVYSNDEIALMKINLSNIFKHQTYFHKNQFPRDIAMYSNLEAISKICDKEEKIIVFAHNAHISKKEPAETTMGDLLNKHYPNKYYALGFEFGKGEYLCTKSTVGLFRLFIRGVILRKNVSEFFKSDVETIAYNSESEILKHLNSQENDILFFDLNSLAENQKIFSLLHSEQIFHNLGSTCASFENSFAKKIWSDSFDGIYYIDKISATNATF